MRELQNNNTNTSLVLVRANQINEVNKIKCEGKCDGMEGDDNG
jgi:hypothetical protein